MWMILDEHIDDKIKNAGHSMRATDLVNLSSLKILVKEDTFEIQTNRMVGDLGEIRPIEELGTYLQSLFAEQLRKRDDISIDE